MNGKAGIVLGIIFTVLAFIFGLLGIALFIGTEGATKSPIVTIATVAIPCALLAGLMSWITPQARWAIAVAMAVPAAIFGVIGSWSSAYLFVGTLWIIALTLAGAYLGGRLKSGSSSNFG